MGAMPTDDERVRKVGRRLRDLVEPIAANVYFCPEAQEQYRSALAIAPGDSVAACRLASSLYSQAKYGEAIELLRDLIHKKPRSYCAYFTLGVAFADAGIYRDAVRMWKKVVEIAPSSPENTRAWIPGDCVSSSTNAARLDPSVDQLMKPFF